MSAALTLVILIASRDASDPAADALGAAARAALGGDVDVVVRVVPQLPPDDGALETGRTFRADAVAEVTWADSEHRRAALHVHPRPAAHWIDREIRFDPSDADVERGRTLGFALAAMMPDRARVPAPPPPPELPPVTGDKAQAAAAPAATARHRAIAAVDVLGAGALGGDATGIGGGMTGRFFLDSHFALMIAGAARAGQDSAAHATPLVLYAGGGVGWRAFRADAPFRLGGRLDMLVLRESLSRAGSGTQARWVPGADLLAEAIWRIPLGAAVLLGVGGETAFGSTDVFVRGQKVSTIPPLRLVAMAGVEALF